MAVDTYLPSEHELCGQFSATRTTVRKALDELLREGYIVKEHGRGSRVVERGRSLGLLTVKGFSGSTHQAVDTQVTQPSEVREWVRGFAFPPTDQEQKSTCVFFQRVRSILGTPVVVENNWYSTSALEFIHTADFIDGSFFKTLRQKYHVEIMGVEQQIRAEPASAEVARMLKLAPGQAILFISIRFKTSKPDLNLYGSWYCNTKEYPIGSSYFR